MPKSRGRSVFLGAEVSFIFDIGSEVVGSEVVGAEVVGAEVSKPHLVIFIILILERESFSAQAGQTMRNSVVEFLV